MLDNGILSYYDSQDDVGKGSKGSIKMAVCEIKGGCKPGDPPPLPLLQPFPLQEGTVMARGLLGLPRSPPDPAAPGVQKC